MTAPFLFQDYKPMSLYAKYETSKAAEVKGARIVKGTTEDGKDIVFILARMSKSNNEYAKAFEARTAPHKRSIQKGTFSEEKAAEIQLDLFAEKILKGWENVTDRDGNVLEFTEENVKRLMNDLPDLYEELKLEALDISNFLEASQEVSAKN